MYLADLKIIHRLDGNGDRRTCLHLTIGALQFDFVLSDKQKLALLEEIAGGGEVTLPVTMNEVVLPHKPPFKCGPYFVINEETMRVRQP